MKLSRKVGATSQILQIFIADSSSTTGAGLTGLVFNSASLVSYYHRDTDTTATAIALVTMTVGTFTSSGFKEIDSTNMPGWYQLCPPDAAFASGAKSVGIHLKGATNMAPLPIEVDLDSQVDVTFWNGTVVATPATAGIPDINVKNMNNVAATSITTINANIGLTQPLNFTGTGGSALAKSDMVDVAGAAVSATTAQLGVNVVNWNNTVVATPATAGIPDINVKNAANTAWASGAITRSAFSADSGFQSSRSNTAQAGAAGTITLDASASATTDFYKGLIIYLTGGTGAGQARVCTAYNGSTKVASIAPNWATNPDSSSTFALMDSAGSDIELWNGSIPNALISGRVDSNTQATASTLTFNMTGNVSGSVGSLTTNNDKTGYSLTQAFPSNFSSLAITAGGIAQADIQTIKTQTVTCSGGVTVPAATLASTTNITAGIIATVTNLTNAPTAGDFTSTMKTSLNAATPTASLSAGDSPVLQSGTAAAGAASTITIATAIGADSLPVGCKIKITSGTGAGQARVITAYVNSTKVVTVDRAWTTNPDATSVYSILYDESTALGSSLKVSGVILTDITTTVTSGVTVTTNNDKTGYTLSVTPPTATAIATAVWQDTTSGDFTVASSIGKSLYTTGNAPGAASGLAIVGSNMGSVSSVTGSVGSVVGLTASNLDTTVSSRMATYTQPTGFLTATFPSGTVANTTNITAGTITTVTNLTNAPTAGDFTSTMKTSLNNATPIVILSAGDSPIIQTGTAAAGAGSTITLATALGADSLPNGCIVKITSGTGIGQARVITGYVNSTKVVTVDRAWTTNPDNTSVYAVLYNDLPSVSSGQKITEVVLADTATTLTNAPTDSSGTTTLLSRLSSTRAGYLDNLSAGAVALASGVIVTTNNDKTGYSLTQTFPANFSSLAITAGGIAQADLQTIKTQSVTCSGGVTVPAATLASTTNIIAGTIATVTNLTNAPTAGDFTSTMKTSLTNSSVASVTGSIGSIAAAGISRSSFATDTGLVTIRSNTAQAGAGTTITLDASASASNSFYNNCLISITGGTGVGQTRFITAYVGATKVATIGSSWVTNPDNTSTFAITGFDSIPGATAPTAAQNATAVWQDLLSGSDFGTAGSVGALVKADIDATISSRAAPTDIVSGGAITTSGGIAKADLQTIKTQAVTCSGGVTIPAATLASTTNITAGTIATVTNGVIVTTNNDKTGYSLSQTFPTNFSSLGISVDGHISNVDTLTTYTGNTLQTGDSYGIVNNGTYGNSAIHTQIGSPQQVGTKYATTLLASDVTGNVPSDIQTIKTQTVTCSGGVTVPASTLASVSNITSGTITTVTNLTNAPTSGDFTSTMKTSLNNATPTVNLSAGESNIMQTGTATAGAASTITIQTALGADNLPVGSLIKITSGTGAKQARIITGYIDSTKVTTVDRSWTINPDATSVYTIMYNHLAKKDSSLQVTAGSVINGVTVTTNNDKTGYTLSSSGLDNITIETGLNARQVLAILAAAESGQVSVSGSTITIKAANNSGTTRIIATGDTSGNRTAITLSPPA